MGTRSIKTVDSPISHASRAQTMLEPIDPLVHIHQHLIQPSSGGSRGAGNTTSRGIDATAHNASKPRQSARSAGPDADARRHRCRSRSRPLSFERHELPSLVGNRHAGRRRAVSVRTAQRDRRRSKPRPAPCQFSRARRGGAGNVEFVARPEADATTMTSPTSRWVHPDRTGSQPSHGRLPNRCSDGIDNKQPSVDACDRSLEPEPSSHGRWSKLHAPDPPQDVIVCENEAVSDPEPVPVNAPTVG